MVINTISAFLFYKGQKDDINIKGAFIHLLVDALVSVGVVISGIIIYYTNWNIMDPIISLFIALIIVISTWSLLKESIKLILNGVPKNIDVDKVDEILTKPTRVIKVHHTHLWAISTNTNALTSHIVIDKKDFSSEKINALKKEIKHKLAHENINHITLQFETEEDDCKEYNCD